MTPSKVTTWVAALILVTAAPTAAQQSGAAQSGQGSQASFANAPALGPAEDPSRAPPAQDADSDVFQPDEPGWLGGPQAPAGSPPAVYSDEGDVQELPLEFFGGGAAAATPKRESWLYRPFSASAFLGGLIVDDPIPGRVKTGAGFFTGFRFGWDFAPAWGLESRFGFSKTATEDPNNVRQLGDGKIFLFDINWLWYPTGDTRWRPYLSLGTGMADVDLIDDQNVRLHETLFGLPLGGGLKYRVGSRLAFRLDVLDNIAFGSGSRLSDMHNVSISAGLEWRFGGARRAYWPWNPSRNWW